VPALIKEAKAENFFGDAFSPRSILRTKPTLQSAGLVLSHSGNDRYRNIRNWIELIGDVVRQPQP
jgi:hypothetical protein